MISKIAAATIIAALLVNNSNAIQMNKMLKERVQTQWRDEA